VIVTRFGEAKPYDAVNHTGCEAVRLQGLNVSPVDAFWVGISHFEPGGGAEWDATDADKVYVVLDGELTVDTEDDSVVLSANDSVFIGPNERRRVANVSDKVASWVVVIAPRS
jgi:mannose-6-phosphate isomerase-like protein (cupin superfamily)